MRFRGNSQATLNFDDLVVDNFAGGGGASTGIEAALGRPVDIAINHDHDAIRMHEVNHPHTMHLCESVWDVDPSKVTNGRPIGLAWFSPDCTHFSKARGGIPVKKEIRGLAWVALRWASIPNRPRVIILENVEEFTTWGPLVADANGDLYPCQKRKGWTFKSFVRALERQGYAVEYRELRACDYGAPTIRKRFFLVARCDGLPIVWPAPTHGPGLQPYRTAAECIDWSLPCPSIFLSKEEGKAQGVRRPLADATLRRIAAGVMRYVVNSADPFIVKVNHGYDYFRGQAVSEPLQTITSKHGYGVVVPTLAPFITEHANASNQRNMPADEPLRTICAEVKGGHFALVSAFLAKHYTGVVGSDMRYPIGTITAIDHHSLVTSHLVKLKGTCKDGRRVDEPIHTIQAGGLHYGEVRAFLIKFYSEGGQWQSLTDPMHTIPTKDRLGLVVVRGELYQIVDIGMRMLTPGELFRAQGFPADYIYDRDIHGKTFTKTAQVARCGNSVPPQFAEALVRANLVQAARADVAA